MSKNCTTKIVLIFPLEVFGSWFDYVNGWWEKKLTCSNLLYMFYEDLVEVSISVHKVIFS